MSIICLDRVWQNSKSGGSELLLLLALADNADDGGYCWPSIATLAKKTRLSERQVIRVMKKLEDSGELEVDHRRNAGNRYWINVWPPEEPEPTRHVRVCAKCKLVADMAATDMEKHHVIPKQYGGTDEDTNLIDLCVRCHRALHKLIEGALKGYTEPDTWDVIYKVTSRYIKSDIAMSHDPSLTVKEPLYKKEGAMPTFNSGNKQGTMFLAATDFFQRDPNLMTVTEKTRIGKLAKELLSRGVTVQEVNEAGPLWSKEDWRGQQGQAPTKDEHLYMMITQLRRGKKKKAVQGI